MANTEINDVLNNPYIGWAPWAQWGPYPQPHRLVYAQFTWREMEPTKGNFDWSAMETRLKFSYWKGRGVKIILRFVMDLPGSSSHKDIPDWLYSEINGDGTWYSQGFSPNYKNSVLISNHARVVSALAQRYNNDPGIAYVAIGSLGHWGENHTVYLNPSDKGYMPPISISDQYVQPYINGFTNKKLLMRRPFQIAKENRLGLYNDMFGNPTETQRFIDFFTNGYSSSGDWGVAAGTYPAMPDFWKYAPSGGEIGDCPGLQYFSNSNIQRTLQQAADSHTSWLGPCTLAEQAVGSSLQANMDSLLKKMGYRFVLQSENHSASVSAGSSLNVTMQWNNKGVAPFYYRWPLELSLSDSSGKIAAKANTNEDIRTWLPGVKSMTHALSIPSTLSQGTYTLCVAILDPDTGTPGVDFAMTGKRADGRYNIGSVSVTGSTPPPSTITIDGNASDWNSIGTVTTNTVVYSMKVTNDTSSLYVCVQGKGLNSTSQFYINSDGNSSTGYIVYGWSSSGCDYLLENRTLYRYTGNGSTWSWSPVGTVPFARNDTVIEAGIPLSSMNLARPGSVRIGFILNGSITLRLPASGQPLPLYTLK